jgi:hypothetical protein
MDFPTLTPNAAAFFLGWQATRILPDIPKASDFLDKAPLNLMKNAFILEERARQHIIRFMGTALTATWDNDLTDRDFLDLFAASDRVAVRNLLDDERLREAGVSCELSAATRKGDAFSLYTLILPLAVNEGKPMRRAIYIDVVGTFSKNPIQQLRLTSQPEWVQIGP